MVNIANYELSRVTFTNIRNRSHEFVLESAPMAHGRIICLSPGVTMSPGAKQCALSFALTTCNFEETFDKSLKADSRGIILFGSKSLFLYFVAVKYL